MPAEPRRSLPSHPDLDQQRTLAKELLRAFRAGAAEAIQRVRAELPDKARITLADAQFVLSREYGLSSWRALRRRVAELQAAAGRAAPEATPPVGEALRDLVRATVAAGDAHALRRLLTERPDLRPLLDEPIFDFDSPALVFVAGWHDTAVIEVLLEYGADPNRKSSWWAGGFHPLYGASPAAAEKLLAAGAIPDACAAAHLDRADLLERLLAEDPGRVHERGGDGQTPLHFARSRQVVDMLLAAGADIDARDVDHRSTPAQWMLDHRRGAGRYELAAYLVERGAAVDVFLAAALGLTERARALVAADVSLLDRRTNHGDYGPQPPSAFHIYTWTIGQNLSPMQVAAQFEQWATLEAMRPLARPRQRLLAALSGGDEAEARVLLTAQPGLMQELTDDDYRRLPDAGWGGNARAVRLMLDLGFDPATTTESGATALHNAAHQGFADCVEAVLRHPGGVALLEVRDGMYGGTPLGWCMHGSRFGPTGEHAAVARMLLEAGAAPPDGDNASDEVREVIEEHRRRAMG